MEFTIALIALFLLNVLVGNAALSKDVCKMIEEALAPASAVFYPSKSICGVFHVDVGSLGPARHVPVRCRRVSLDIICIYGLSMRRRTRDCT